MKKKILVTGAAGFIGFHLCMKLLEEGYEVIGLDNINDYYDVNLKYARLKLLGIEEKDIKDNTFVFSSIFKNFKFIKIDIENSLNLNTLCSIENFDSLCNLAGQAGVRYSIENPHVYIQSNIVGFLNILEVCRLYNIKNLCFASSSSVYGLNESQPFKTEDKTDKPASLYAATKKANELMAHSYSHLYGINCTALRFFTVYGPFGRPDMAPMIFTKNIIKGKKINVFNNGEMSRDFTFIDDIIEGIVKVINTPSKYKVYNIANNKAVKLLDFISVLENELNIKAIKNFMPMQKGDVISTYADISEIKKDLDYNPKTSIKKGVKIFINWYKNFYIN